MKRVLAGVAIAVSVLVLIQFVPYGRDHTNPPVQQEPFWNVSDTRMLVKRACFDCHSNETVWPWYANIAPVSWLVQRDVDEGRRALNFSEWNHPQEEMNAAITTVEKREMPPRSYLALHPGARLQPSQREALIRGLAATIDFPNVGLLTGIKPPTL
jgi:Haem-binding domain